MRELLLEYLSDLNIASLVYEREEYKGQAGYKVTLRLHDGVNTEHTFWFSALNRMDAEHMAAVMRSYIKIDREKVEIV